ncbi:Hypothetical protein Tpal_2798 [Trichococcus palustris]|jgi:hypothetical protein|uniref:Uncharacterized protein n=1 Tax=Trichococcus palustris TaxID=140314 RepID=A0A143YZY3_9LACT|nr:hypothetical protein [Trichococcus palustris]CZR02974.1 Hypothetical protein Tpal_2798 [Trichococcus palustris]SFL22298.1 hypothetical protein SAMN04488076_1452 [Trichococcus palustris]
MTKENIVAGTIMITNKAEETFFLVAVEGESNTLPTVEMSGEGKSPLGSIMESLLKHVNVDSESLRLLDLTNIRGNGRNIPLFVFDALEKPADVDTVLTDRSHFAWKKSSDITEILTDWELGGVPIYH